MFIVRNKNATMSLGSEKLIRLLNIGSDVKDGREETDDDQDKTEQLSNLLSQSIIIPNVSSRKLHTSLVSIKQQVLLMCEESVGAMLQSPRTDIRLLRKIKTRFKTLALSSASEPVSCAAKAVCAAAIASALVFHSARISSFKDEELKKHFTEFLRSRWITAELRELFRNACEVC
jgi:hypothetical protein